jgi:hypothetical protein
VDIGAVELDASTGLTLQQVSLPLINGQNKVVGSITWGVRAAGLPCKARGASYQALSQAILDHPNLTPNAAAFASTVLLAFSWDPALVAAVETSNAKQLDQEEIWTRDADWRAANAAYPDDDGYVNSPLQNATLHNAGAVYLRQLQTSLAVGRNIPEIFLMGLQVRC